MLSCRQVVTEKKSVGNIKLPPPLLAKTDELSSSSTSCRFFTPFFRRLCLDYGSFIIKESFYFNWTSSICGIIIILEPGT